MRLKFALSAVTIFFVLSIAFIPTLILSSVTKVDITQVKPQTYQSIIHCNGEIIEKRVKEIYLETPVIAQEVRVQVGDRVRKGQRLVTIDTKLTQRVLAQGAVATNLDSSAQNTEALGALAAQYGLSAADVQSAVSLYGTSQAPAPATAFIPQEIMAPLDGIITAVNLQTDVLTKTTKPVLVVSDDTAYAARVSVNEADIAQLRVGNRATITGVGFSGESYCGVVTKIYPAAHKVLSGTTQQTVVDVELSIENADAKLKPGFTVKAVITTKEGGEMLTVPYEAVGQEENNQEYLYVYQENMLKKHYIETGSELIDAVEITSGIEKTDYIVVNPDNIKDDERFAYAVKILDKQLVHTG